MAIEHWELVEEDVRSKPKSLETDSELEEWPGLVNLVDIRECIIGVDAVESSLVVGCISGVTDFDLVVEELILGVPDE